MEFVRTEEFDETIEDLKRMFRFLRNPRNLLSVLGLGSFFIAFYFSCIILADIIK